MLGIHVQAAMLENKQTRLDNPMLEAGIKRRGPSWFWTMQQALILPMQQYIGIYRLRYCHILVVLRSAVLQSHAIDFAIVCWKRRIELLLLLRKNSSSSKQATGDSRSRATVCCFMLDNGLGSGSLIPVSTV